MTRQERRRKKRQKQTTYSLTPEQIIAYQEKADKKAKEDFFANWNEKKKELVHETFAQFIAVALLTARDHLGFGEVRLKRFAQKLVEVYNDWDNHTFTSEDIFEALKDETGLDLKLAINYSSQTSELVINE